MGDWVAGSASELKTFLNADWRTFFKKGPNHQDCFTDEDAARLFAEDFTSASRYRRPDIKASVRDPPPLLSRGKASDLHVMYNAPGRRKRNKALLEDLEGWSDDREASSEETELVRPKNVSKCLSEDMSSISKAMLNSVMPRLEARQLKAMDRAFEKSSAKVKASPLSPASRQLQGSRIVEEAGYIPMDECVGVLPAMNIMQRAAKCWSAAVTAVNKKVQQMRQSEVKPETRPQLQLSKFCRRVQANGLLRPGLRAWDTHAHGFIVHNSAGKQKPDMSFVAKHNEPAYLVSLCEAKRDLGSKTCLDDVAEQQKERVFALMPYQRKRSRWTFASSDASSIKIWVWTKDSVRATTTFRIEAAPGSEGLQVFMRLLRTSIEELGFHLPELPDQLHSVAEQSKFETHARISEEPTLSTADVLNGALMLPDGSRIQAVAKTSQTVTKERRNFERLREQGLDGKFTPIYYGVATPSSSTTQYILEEHAGKVLAELDDPAVILDCIISVSESVGALGSKGIVHGDISPYNICHSEEKGTKLLDLQTMQGLKDVNEAEHLRPSDITGTLLFPSVSVHEHQPRTASTDLESLLYVLLWMSTDQSLPWRDASIKTAADAKRAVMLDNAKFALLMEEVQSPALRKACVSLRELFFSKGNYTTSTTAAEVTNALKEAQKLGNKEIFCSP